MKNIILILLLITATNITAQFDLPDLKDIESIDLKVYWGEVTVLGNNTGNAAIEINYTDAQNKRREIIKNESREFVSIEKKGRSLEISAREPATFESIDLTLFVPADKQVNIELIKGGDIYVENLDSGIEVNQRNGSFDADGISKYAMVNLANGSINIEFDRLDPELPVSLVTLNGEVKVALPSNVNRDLRLISEKNGYVVSDFELTSVTDIPNLNKREYSKSPIRSFAKLNGGGSLLFMSTQNGPLLINKN